MLTIAHRMLPVICLPVSLAVLCPLLEAEPAETQSPAAQAESATEVRDAVDAKFRERGEPYDESTRYFLANLDVSVEPEMSGTHAEAKQKADPASTPVKNPGNDEQGLAAKLQNPIANLISVPIQFNWDTGIGPDDDKDKIIVNVQPVIPFHLNEDWNLISRTIIPVVYAEGPASGISSEFGIGDTTQSLFFSPVKPVGGWIVGVGPVFQIPTGTDNLFRSKQFSIGPTGIALKQDKVGDGILTYGALVNHLWRVAGSDDVDDVNATFLQPFIAYTTKGGSTFSLNSETSYDWTHEEWSVPINAMFAQLLHFGKQPVQLQFGGRYYADTVPNGPEWGVRFAITFLFPE